MQLPPELADMANVTAFEDDQPFRHWIVDGLFDPMMLKEAEESFDDHVFEPGWVYYDGEFERKATFNLLAAMPDPVRRCIYEWNTDKFAKQLGNLTGIVGLEPDPRMWGGGMHVMPRGGYLKPHLDHSHNPNGMERRLSMIVYLNTNWADDWGGAFELWSNAGHWPVKKIPVKFNRTVLFESAATAWHGVPMAISCPFDTMRKTIALYYLAKPRDGIVHRARAEFAVPFATPALVAEAHKRAMPREEPDDGGDDD